MNNRTKIIRLLEPQIKELENVILDREIKAYENALYIVRNMNAPQKSIKKNITRLKDLKS